MTYEEFATINIVAFAKVHGIKPNTLRNAIHKPIPNEIYNPDAVNVESVKALLDKNGIDISALNPDDYAYVRRRKERPELKIGNIYYMTSCTEVQDCNGVETTVQIPLELVAMSDTYVCVEEPNGTFHSYKKPIFESRASLA
jgi:hypothetical protein